MARLCLQVRWADAKNYAELVAQGDTFRANGCYRAGDIVQMLEDSAVRDKEGKVIPPAPLVGSWFLFVDDLEMKDRKRYTSPHQVAVPEMDNGVPIIGRVEPDYQHRRRLGVVLDELPQSAKDELMSQKWTVVGEVSPLIIDKVTDERLSNMTEAEKETLDRELDWKRIRTEANI